MSRTMPTAAIVTSGRCGSSSRRRNSKRFPPWSSPLTCRTASSRSSSAMASAESNPIRFSWAGPRPKPRSEAFGATLRLLARLQRSIICARLVLVGDESATKGARRIVIATLDEAWDAPEGTIDVWWRGNGERGSDAAVGPPLASESRVAATIRSGFCESYPATRPWNEVREHIAELGRRVANSRRACCDGCPRCPGGDSDRIARRGAADAGVRTARGGQEAAFYRRMERLAGNLPRVLFVDSAGGMELES